MYVTEFVDTRPQGKERGSEQDLQSRVQFRNILRMHTGALHQRRGINCAGEHSMLTFASSSTSSRSNLENVTSLSA